MKRYSLHVHTRYSSCGSCEPAEILEIAKRLGFDGIAITDHNTIQGALEAKRLNKDKDFEVIVGEEVSTDIGHVLVYFLKKVIKPGKVENVIAEARGQDALCVLAHPFNGLTNRIMKLLGITTWRKSLAPSDYDMVSLFDAIEAFNARCLLKLDNRRAAKLAERYKKPIIAGSDAHFSNEMGNAWVEFDDRFSLREALTKGKLSLHGKRRHLWANKIKSTIRSLSRRV